MSKEKQIEEMAKELAKIQCNKYGCEDCEFYQFECDDLQHYTKIAELLYNAGYRKQEWISVEERLPERCGYYLGCTYKGGMLIAPFFPVFANDKPEFHYKIAYWMPLPEAPKGGAE